MSIEWRIDHGLVPFEEADTFMKDRVRAIQEGTAPECIWLLQHPPLYTAGTSAKENDLIAPSSLPVHHIGRGGQYTYHGPGQRICYVMLDLKTREKDIKKHVRTLEKWGINAFAMCGVKAFCDDVGVGLWVNPYQENQDKKAKIAAIGVRVSRWVTSYGIAFNIAPNLEHYKGIIPCGIKGHGVTPLHAMGHPIPMSTFDDYLRMCFDI